ncbi:very-long-chain 3-oxoacyl-CoA reductase-like [Centruroides vittatus]|uniref:very-long-chain 3-oxoacyl-CoA reductase-like n=1 Tax=Centruroides vittatus TaxID=120091 RepID=UPI00350E98E0
MDRVASSSLLENYNVPNCREKDSYLLMDYEPFLVAVGILVTLYIFLTMANIFFQLIFVHFLLWIFPSSAKNYGKWAVITGGNSGIGRSYAFHFAKQGTNVIIIARNVKTLRSTAEEIRRKHRVQCHYIQADLTKEDVFKCIAKELEGKDIGILVNNAGYNGNLPRRFLSETESNVLIMINLHMTAVIQMTRLVLPTMLAKGRGAIVTISSLSSLNPFPRLNVYSSSKAFADRFARSIALECSGKGLHVQSLIPGYVSTRMINFVCMKAFVPSSDAYVKCAERTIGILDYTTGYWIHEVCRYFLLYTSFLPISYRKYLILKSLLKIRKLLLKI